MTAVLCAHEKSYYKILPDLDVFDIKRNALTWEGNDSVIAHPPCRAFGRLRSFANPRPGEYELAVWCADMVRKFGGVLEHPAGSTLWHWAMLPRPGVVDSAGGWTLPISQKWFGHKAEKLTWLYICGVGPREIPACPYAMHEASHTVGISRGTLKRPEVTKAERELTPPRLAIWLAVVASLCRPERLRTAKAPLL